MDVMGLSQNHSRHSPIPVSQAVFPPFPILSANRVSYHPRNPAAASLGKKKKLRKDNLENPVVLKQSKRSPHTLVVRL